VSLMGAQITNRPHVHPGITLPEMPRHVRMGLLFAFAVMPLTFPPFGLAGFRLSGWLWLTELVLLAPMALTEPLHRRAVRYLTPYLLFLVYAMVTLLWAPMFGSGVKVLLQLAVPAVAYLIAWRVPNDVALQDRLRTISRWGLAVAAVLAAGGLVLGNRVIFGPVSRPASLSLVVLFVTATLDSRSWRVTLLVAALALLLTVAAGARAASVVLVVMLLTSRSLGLRWQGRVAIAVACVLLLLMASRTEAFKQRFFFNEDATLMDAVTLSGNLNTAGRRELWPRLWHECSPTALTGLGIGSASPLSLELSGRGVDQPHNEYLRTYCDVGLVGGATFWAFFLWAALRSWRGALRGPDRRLHAAAGQLVIALLLFAITDNPLLYTALFTVPIALVLGLSDSTLARSRRAYSAWRR
jgi:O-antigen ligase